MSYQPRPENVALMNRMIAEVPGLLPLYTDHMQDNDGEMLPHLLMADFARFAVANAQDLPSRFHLKKLLDCLEDGLRSGDENVRDLIGASFAWNLQGEDSKAIDVIKQASGPLLRKQIADLHL